jgi:hypothetical protein
MSRLEDLLTGALAKHALIEMTKAASRLLQSSDLRTQADSVEEEHWVTRAAREASGLYFALPPVRRPSMTLLVRIQLAALSEYIAAEMIEFAGSKAKGDNKFASEHAAKERKRAADAAADEEGKGKTSIGTNGADDQEDPAAAAASEADSEDGAELTIAVGLFQLQRAVWHDEELRELVIRLGLAAVWGLQADTPSARKRILRDYGAGSVAVEVEALTSADGREWVHPGAGLLLFFLAHPRKWTDLYDVPQAIQTDLLQRHAWFHSPAQTELVLSRFLRGASPPGDARFLRRHGIRPVLLYGRSSQPRFCAPDRYVEVSDEHIARKKLDGGGSEDDRQFSSEEPPHPNRPTLAFDAVALDLLIDEPTADGSSSSSGRPWREVPLLVEFRSQLTQFSDEYDHEDENFTDGGIFHRFTGQRIARFRCGQGTPLVVGETDPIIDESTKLAAPLLRQWQPRSDSLDWWNKSLPQPEERVQAALGHVMTQAIALVKCGAQQLTRFQAHHPPAVIQRFTCAAIAQALAEVRRPSEQAAAPSATAAADTSSSSSSFSSSSPSTDCGVVFPADLLAVIAAYAPIDLPYLPLGAALKEEDEARTAPTVAEPVAANAAATEAAAAAAAAVRPSSAPFRVVRAVSIPFHERCSSSARRLTRRRDGRRFNFPVALIADADTLQEAEQRYRANTRAEWWSDGGADSSSSNSSSAQLQQPQRSGSDAEEDEEENGWEEKKKTKKKKQTNKRSATQAQLE